MKKLISRIYFPQLRKNCPCIEPPLNFRSYSFSQSNYHFSASLIELMQTTKTDNSEPFIHEIQFLKKILYQL